MSIHQREIETEREGGQIERETDGDREEEDCKRIKGEERRKERGEMEWKRKALASFSGVYWTLLNVVIELLVIHHLSDEHRLPFTLHTDVLGLVNVLTTRSGSECEPWSDINQLIRKCLIYQFCLQMHFSSHHFHMNMQWKTCLWLFSFTKTNNIV